jgi:hypothetical protein
MAALAAVPWIAKAVTVAKTVLGSKAVKTGVKVARGVATAKTISDVVNPRRPSVAAAPAELPVPDEEELKRSARRSAAQRKSSRALTVLSGAPDSETLG